jgi:hypothetical protein
MGGPPRLRARKKQQTRDVIAEAGGPCLPSAAFESVNLEDIARDARVSCNTVFNYLPTREDLVLANGDVRV